MIAVTANDELFFFFWYIYIYIYVLVWAGWVFIAAWTFSSCGVWGLLSSGGVQASHGGGFSCCGSRVHRLQ